MEIALGSFGQALKTGDFDPIDIDSEIEFTALGIPGIGSFNDPFIIENKIIDGDGNKNGIRIVDISLYFIIRNCTISNCVTGIVLSGIGQ